MFQGQRDEFDPKLPRLTGRDGELPAPESLEPSEVIPDDLVDAMLDGEVPSNKVREVRSAIRGDGEAERRFNKTNQILDLLRHTQTAAQAPDLTAKIMARVERERSLLNRLGVRRVTWARFAAAAALALVIGGAFLVERQAPQTFTLVPRPAPVNDLVSAVPQQTAGVLATVENAVNAAGSFVPAQFEQARLRDAAALARRQRDGGNDLVPAMNPPTAAVLWLEPSSASDKVVSVRMCGGAPCAGRRMVVPAQQVSLRSILAGDERPSSNEDTLVAFRR
jgi:hypothetical protein